VRKLYTWLFSHLVRWSTHYDQGWVDGWNACRAAEPDQRVFMASIAKMKAWTRWP
jgi:hypothetical protein